MTFCIVTIMPCDWEMWQLGSWVNAVARPQSELVLNLCLIDCGCRYFSFSTLSWLAVCSQWVLLTYLFDFLLGCTAVWEPWPFVITDSHFSLSTAFCNHFLTFISHLFFSIFQPSHSRSSILLLPSGWPPNMFLTTLPWPVPTRWCLIYFNPLFLCLLRPNLGLAGAVPD